MKSTMILAFLILMIIKPAFSQSGIQGRVYDVDSNGIAFANVLLLNKEDSLLIRGAVTDENGNFHIADLSTGTYSIESTMIGYSKTVLPTVNLTNPGDLVLGPIILLEDANELEEVLVKATKPLYEVEIGKMVINVQSSITSAGLSAIDVLERSPGVYVNRQENSISLGGKDGVAVLMNGKRSRMPMEALYQ
ncbi:MAG TPA: carboxypeptidase-like regulatory domain-containing protein, partial [Cyclobacteriaceae bacterium]|nr:carboxypeptidase-like regulatory domain-containing protein [Cyclobacteriaceae bacterium]